MKLRLAVFATGLALGGLWLFSGPREAESWTPPPGPRPQLATAVFAMGCFWCAEPPFDAVPGVYATTSGYAGGSEKNPTYEQVSSGRTGHRESLQVEYDPKLVTYEQLLEVFWHNIDPTDAGGQFCDRGPQYRSAVFYEDEAQQKTALESKRKLEGSGRLRQVVTEVLPLPAFYKAEEYHQNFCRKNPARYNGYRAACGRDRRLEAIWGKDAPTAHPAPAPAAGAGTAGAGTAGQCVGAPAKGRRQVKEDWKKPGKDELKQRLTPLQYEVTQKSGTERAFGNEYWDNHEPGIYVDRVSGEPLFSSLDKFDSGTGWPSFTRPLAPDNVKLERDLSMGMPRLEVRSRSAESHLGHLFDDGPLPTGKRYCLNSAALRFVPADKLEQEGYGQYKKLFEQKTASAESKKK